MVGVWSLQRKQRSGRGRRRGGFQPLTPPMPERARECRRAEHRRVGRGLGDGGGGPDEIEARAGVGKRKRATRIATAPGAERGAGNRTAGRAGNDRPALIAGPKGITLVGRRAGGKGQVKRGESE